MITLAQWIERAPAASATHDQAPGTLKPLLVLWYCVQIGLARKPHLAWHLQSTVCKQPGAGRVIPSNEPGACSEERGLYQRLIRMLLRRQPRFYKGNRQRQHWVLWCGIARKVMRSTPPTPHGKKNLTSGLGFPGQVPQGKCVRMACSPGSAGAYLPLRTYGPTRGTFMHGKHSCHSVT